MKANELMIGDWVKCTYWTPSKQLKVAEIRRIMDDEIKIGVYCNDLVLIFRQSEVKPISLTPEILERNGFVKQYFDGWEYIHPDDSTFSYIDYRILWRTDYDNHLFIKKYKGSSISATLQISGINYVHQLQHALRFFGIDKTIEL